ncbi:MAG: DUF4339 domain-containing protein [Verrucomicrobia bacterium]|nr:DUF4339 domain-containing protein [Verrucomicrobiota bacterium]MDE3099663.1 DUF4339 domain-containing protein [Verrucomicrobiota bacterium]
MANYIIIGGDGREYGPVSGEAVRQWIAEGRANPQTQAKAESDAAFRPLSAFPEFADAFGPPPPLPGAPPTFPGTPPGDYELDIGRCISRGWGVVKNNFWPAVGISALIMLIVSAFNQIPGLVTGPIIRGWIENHTVSATGVFVVVAMSVLTAPVYCVLWGGLMKYFLKLARGQQAGIGDAFAGFGALSGQLILLGWVMNILVSIGYVLCVIPGLFFQVAWMFAIVLVIDRGMDFWEAMETSRRMVCKHWFMVFAFLIVNALLMAGGVVACCVGIFVTMPIGWAAMMSAYETIFSGARTD